MEGNRLKYLAGRLATVWQESKWFRGVSIGEDCLILHAAYSPPPHQIPKIFDGVKVFLEIDK